MYTLHAYGSYISVRAVRGCDGVAESGVMERLQAAHAWCAVYYTLIILMYANQHGWCQFYDIYQW